MSAQACDLTRVVIACLCITIVEVVALCKGKNGFMLRLSVVALAGIAGFSLAQLVMK